MWWKQLLILNLLVQFSFENFLWADVHLYEPEKRCQRSFTYHSRQFEMDSTRKLDGEGLRFVLKSNNKSETLLNEYQQKLQPPSWPAYMGFAGLALSIAGPIYASRQSDNDTQHQITSISLFGAAGLILGSFLISQIFIKNNKSKLDDAVKTYNRSASPSDRIQVGIAPLPEGGGQVNTTVPF